MKHEWILHILAFFAIAFFSGMFFPVFYAIIGAPAYLPHPEAPLYEDAQVLNISKPGMIFRWYGKWLCRKQNEFEELHDKSRIFAVKKPEGCVGINVETSYGRTGLKVRKIPQNEGYWGLILLPGETAILNYQVEKNYHGKPVQQNSPLYEERQVMFTQTNPTFDRTKMPLSPYKAMGLCNYCTVFWFMFAALISACFVGIVPFSYLASFLILPAYGIAHWGSQMFEI